MTLESNKKHKVLENTGYSNFDGEMGTNGTKST